MNYNEHLTAHRRLTILILLANAAAYTLHEQVLKMQLAGQAEAVSTDVLRADLQWLADQGLLVARQDAGYWSATLTARGNDVAAGLAVVPGVARPEPK